MCSCTSCSYTDSFAGKGFAEWPRGDPAGKYASEQAYAAHVRQYVADFIAQNGYITEEELAKRAEYRAMVKREEAAARRREKAGDHPARPAHPGKGERHLPELDRQPESAVIYAMPKEKPKRPVGRPPMPGRRVVVKLEERHIKAAKKLGGSVAAGIRKALA